MKSFSNRSCSFRLGFALPVAVALLLALLSSGSWGAEIITEESTTLSVEQAEKLVEVGRTLKINNLAAISDEVAEVLARHTGGDLHLNGLETVTDKALQALARHEGSLYLNGLRMLSDAGAKALESHKFGLYLNGLATVSDDTAASLSRHEGYLSLNGLTSLSQKAADCLRAKKYFSLPENAAIARRATKTKSSETAAKTADGGQPSEKRSPLLRNWAGADGKKTEEAEFLKFDGANVFVRKANGVTAKVPLEKLSAADQKFVKEQAVQAEVEPARVPEKAVMQEPRANPASEITKLSPVTDVANASPENAGSPSTLTADRAREMVEQGIYIDSSTSVTDEAASILSQHKSGLFLNGLTTLSEEAAKALAQHQGGSLWLNGLTTISDEVAKALAQHQGGSLSLNGLATISDEAAKALAQHSGRSLSLNGLATISDETAKALSQHHSGSLLLDGLTTISAEATKALSANRLVVSRALVQTAISAEATKAFSANRLAVSRALVQVDSEIGETNPESQPHQPQSGEESREEALRQQEKPTWSGSEDLDAILAEFPHGAAGQLEQFIRYGTAENARKATAGDRFDREEAAEAAKAHRDKLASRAFHLRRQYRWDGADSPENKPNSIELYVPLSFRCTTPSGYNIRFVFCRDEAWFLTKNGTIMQCRSAQEVRAVKANNGILYIPEVLDRCDIKISVSGSRDELKALARDPQSHVVNMAFRGFKLERPFTKGFFKFDVLQSSGRDCGGLLRSFNVGLNGPPGQPNYFVVQELGGVDDSTMPEGVTAELIRCEIVAMSPTSREVVFEWKKDGSLLDPEERDSSD